jgi:hypothetical protein
MHEKEILLLGSKQNFPIFDVCTELKPLGVNVNFCHIFLWKVEENEYRTLNRKLAIHAHINSRKFLTGNIKFRQAFV